MEDSSIANIDNKGQKGYKTLFRMMGAYLSSAQAGTLEQLVTAGDGHESYYQHGVTYCAMGYTFLEDFFECLNCEILENILA